jgi:hypothetical protein
VGNPHAGFDEAGAGNGLSGTAPALDPTCEGLRVKLPRSTRQYFIGYGEYRDEEPFEASMMVHFRKRLGLVELSGINELIHSTHWK